MGPTVRAPKEFWLGFIYLIAGAIGWYVGREYPFGSAARMGPGFFPTLVSVLLVLFGLASIGRSLLMSGTIVGRVPWKVLGLVASASIAFALLLRPLGFVPASTVLLLMSAAASSRFHVDWRAAVGLTALITFSALVFVKGLGLPIPLIGRAFLGFGG